MARDKIHSEVKQALENEGWHVTNDPLNIKTVPIDIHDRFKEEPLISGVLEDEQINTLVYNQFEQKIEKWIK